MALVVCLTSLPTLPFRSAAFPDCRPELGSGAGRAAARPHRGPVRVPQGRARAHLRWPRPSADPHRASQGRPQGRRRPRPHRQPGLNHHRSPVPPAPPNRRCRRFAVHAGVGTRSSGGRPSPGPCSLGPARRTQTRAGTYGPGAHGEHADHTPVQGESGSGPRPPALA